MLFLVPNLWPTDEMKQLLEDMAPFAKEVHRDADRETIFGYFVERCKNNLHIVVCMSPVGDSFRTRTRRFPSLVNCCTVDWFADWPKSALRSVASQFMDDLKLPEVIKEEVLDICVQIHAITLQHAEKFMQELRRHYYISPATYLYFIQTFKDLLNEKKGGTASLKQRYESGVERILSTAETVQDMQEKLKALQPQLIVTSKETEALLRSIEVQKKEADEANAIIHEEEIVAEKSAAEARAMKADCEADLNKILPVLAEATAALETLNKNDITEIKSLKSPPQGVKLVMEAICILKGVKPTLENNGGIKTLNYWDNAKKMLGDFKFLQTLLEYDKDNIPQATIDKLEPYISNPEFQPVKIKRYSNAAMSLCSWVRAVETYHKVLLEVKPKREALASAEAQLEDTLQKLAAKKEQLRALNEKIQGLMTSFEAAMAKKLDLENQVTVCEMQSDRAKKLIGGLSGEKQRWIEATKAIELSNHTLIGDVLLSAGVIAYLGAFTGAYRIKSLNNWFTILRSNDLPFSADYSLAKTFSDPTIIRNWQVDGLPADKISIESAIIINRSSRWPLIIDTQGQALNWIKNLESKRKLIVTNFRDGDFMRKLENAVRFGIPAVCQNHFKFIHFF